MVPLVSQVYSATRGVLGDGLATGRVFTDSLLQTHYQAAYAELYRALANIQSPFVQRESYYNVPIQTGYLNPATMGIENLGQPILLEERGGITAWAISSVTPGSAIATVVSAANTLVTGDQPVIYGVGGITDDINDIWTVTPSSATSFTLNGCTATGSYTSGGVVSMSTDSFQEVLAQPRISLIPNAAGSAFGIYSWEGGRFRFPPCSTVRQLRLTYKLSGNAPTTATASVGIDDSLTFLAYRTACFAGRSKGMQVRAKDYMMTAVGPNWESNGWAGGLLGQMLDNSIKDEQRLASSERRSPGYGGGSDYRRSDRIL